MPGAIRETTRNHFNRPRHGIRTKQNRTQSKQSKTKTELAGVEYEVV